ncbi:hypothetical protein BKA64DRAFT_663502 [Cadophora sp. MPI-SDFR-AT-0126]|nr:hypothetical protein BKA64DRAFT_663502 [Leotiomycetes sp. MPI-SDFR-AT-0126]
MHLKFQDVPNEPSLQLLRQIAFLCEQYQCVSIVTPWVEGWISDNNDRELDQAAWPLIAWAFGDEGTFTTVAEGMVADCRYSEDGQLLDAEDNVVQEPLPPGILY